ncbi:MAG: hypothetical protein ACYDCK_10855 [Thermoplasmatota archaeon]
MSFRLLWLALLVGPFALGAFAGASSEYYPSEQDPYCENHPDYTNPNPTIQQWGRDQPAIGYGMQPLPNSDDPSSPLYQNPAGVSERSCEGEQWDGQDTLNPNAENDPNTVAPCSGVTADPTTGAYVVALFQCSDPDHSFNDIGHPLALRESARADTTHLSDAALYSSSTIIPVGTTAVFLSACFVHSPIDGTSGANQGVVTGPALGSPTYGTTPCQGSTGQQTVAWYGKDRTPTTSIACAISAARLTKGYCSPGDCTQIEYDQSAVDPTQPTCGRDNTAITMSLLE